MRIYFEKESLHPIHEFINMVPPRIILGNDGYANMIKDAETAIKNKWDIYTNNISLLGATELFGARFLHKIMIRDDKGAWVELNPHLLHKLETPINIEQYFRKYICN